MGQSSSFISLNFVLSNKVGSIMLADVVVELSPVRKRGKLSENIFVLKHSSQLNFAAKLQNQACFSFILD